MNVFISWSGPRSKAVAELLSEWFRCVLQSVRPWISSKDIDRGALWFSSIGDQLKDTTFGVVCLTAENKDRPWILFESGALAKGLATNRVCTLLIDLQPSDISDPLAQFNHTLPTKDSMRQLVGTLNRSLPLEIALPEGLLDRVFETYWPQFEHGFARALNDNPAGAKPKQRDNKDVLADILDGVRTIGQRVSRLERQEEVQKGAWVKLESVQKPTLKRGWNEIAAKMSSEEFEKYFSDAQAVARKRLSESDDASGSPDSE